MIEQLTALPRTYTSESMNAAAALNNRIRLEAGGNVLAFAQAAGCAAVPDALKRYGGADAVYYGTQIRGVSNAKAKRDLNFQPRPLEWTVG